MLPYKNIKFFFAFFNGFSLFIKTILIYSLITYIKNAKGNTTKEVPITITKSAYFIYFIQLAN